MNMGKVKREPVQQTNSDNQASEQQDQRNDGAGQPSVPAQGTTAVPGTTLSRGRGRGRSRGRGRRVVPRQVARRKPPPQQPKPEPQLSRSSEERGTRGRGQRERGRGRGAMRPAPVYSPNIVGLGQIAPARAPLARIPSSAGSAATSRKSSVVSSMSIGAASSTNSLWAGSSTSSDVGGEGGVGPGIPTPDGAFLMKGEATEPPGVGGMGFSSGKQTTKKEPKGYSFTEHVEADEDSDDDMAADAFASRNRDIAPFAGQLTEEGLLLPVSLLGLRDIPPETHPSKPRSTEVDAVEPTSYSGVLHPQMFDEGTVARKILSSQKSLSFLQLPGLLALTEGSRTTTFGMEGRSDEPRGESSVAAAVAAAERMRGLGTDLRKVGEPDTVRSLGKLRFYKSGRVQLTMERGGVMDIKHGIAPKVCQQAVLIDSSKKTCEELESAISSRLVAVPNFGS